ncbi:hypothetical protein NL676_025989 [Syzygium grande]|nr:hypothetical protein NL676_025989 [Syzygium grande]
MRRGEFFRLNVCDWNCAKSLGIIKVIFASNSKPALTAPTQLMQMGPVVSASSPLDHQNTELDQQEQQLSIFHWRPQSLCC